jgi:hypothetical protein
MYGRIVSSSRMYSGKRSAMFSRFDGNGKSWNLLRRAYRIHFCRGCSGGSVCILVTAFRIFSRSRILGDGRVVS